MDFRRVLFRSRIAIIDFDVHHGNGTEEIFDGDSRVLMCSFFQHPLFPGVYARNPKPNMVNVAVPAHIDNMDLREIVESHWLPRLEAFSPEIRRASGRYRVLHYV